MSQVEQFSVGPALPAFWRYMETVVRSVQAGACQ